MPTRSTSGAWRRCPRWPRTRSRRARDSPAVPPDAHQRPPAVIPELPHQPRALGPLRGEQRIKLMPRRSAGQVPHLEHQPGPPHIHPRQHPPAVQPPPRCDDLAHPADHMAGRHAPRQIRRTGCRCRVNRTTARVHRTTGACRGWSFPAPACAAMPTIPDRAGGSTATAGCRPESGRLRYAAGVAAGIVRCGFDRWRRQRLWRVGEQLRGIVGHRLIRIDDRVRLRRWRAHATSEASKDDNAITATTERGRVSHHMSPLRQSQTSGSAGSSRAVTGRTKMSSPVVGWMPSGASTAIGPVHRVQPMVR